MSAFERERRAFVGCPLVNVVFHSPLALKGVDFDGMTVANFSKKDAKVLVAIAVPFEVAKLGDDASVKKYIVESLHGALEIGAAHLRSKEVAVNPDALFAFACRVTGSIWAN